MGMHKQWGTPADPFLNPTFPGMRLMGFRQPFAFPSLCRVWASYLLQVELRMLLYIFATMATMCGKTASLWWKNATAAKAEFSCGRLLCRECLGSSGRMGPRAGAFPNTIWALERLWVGLSSCASYVSRDYARNPTLNPKPCTLNPKPKTLLSVLHLCVRNVPCNNDGSRPRVKGERHWHDVETIGYHEYM